MEGNNITKRYTSASMLQFWSISYAAANSDNRRVHIGWKAGLDLALNCAGVTSRHHDDTVKTRIRGGSLSGHSTLASFAASCRVHPLRRSPVGSCPPSERAPNSVCLTFKHISFFISLENEPTPVTNRVSQTTSPSSEQDFYSNSKRLQGCIML